MTKFHPIFFLSLLLVTGKINAQLSRDEFEKSIEAGIDPYFIETTDTVSEFGPGSITRGVLKDWEGNMWLATWQGIIRYDGKVFTNFTLKENLKHFHVFSIYEDRGANIWFGTARGGLYRYDGKSFTLFTKKYGLADNTVLCMLADKFGNIWFGTPDGLSFYNGKTFTTFTTKDGLNSNHIGSLLLDKSGRIWVGTDKGLNRYEPVAAYKGGAKLFSSFPGINGEQLEAVNSLQEDKHGKLWIGTRKGLCCYDGSAISNYVIPNFIMYMHLDKKGNLWMAHMDTTVGSPGRFALFRYDGEVFNKVTEQESPDNRQIFQITEDEKGNIWYGSLKGVCRFDVSKANNPCVKKTCVHSGSTREAIEEHRKGLAQTFTYFRP